MTKKKNSNFTEEQIKYLRDLILNKELVDFQECCVLRKFEKSLKKIFKDLEKDANSKGNAKKA